MSSSSTVVPMEIIFSSHESDGDESVSSGVSGFTIEPHRGRSEDDWNPMCRFNCFALQGPMQPRSDLLEVDRDMHKLLLMSQTINSDEEFNFSDSSSLGFSCYDDDDYNLRKEEEKYGSVLHDDSQTQSTDDSYLQPRSLRNRRFEVTKTGLLAALLTAYACSVCILGSHFRTIVIGVKLAGAVTICYWRRGDQPKARQQQARSFIPTTRGLLIILYVLLWNQAVGGAGDYFLLNDGPSFKLPYGVHLLSPPQPGDDPMVYSFRGMTPTLKMTPATLADVTATTLLRRMPDPTPMATEKDLHSPSHHLQLFDDVASNDFATRQEEATSTPDEYIIQSTTAITILTFHHEDIVVPREQEESKTSILSRTKGKICDAITLVKDNVQAHKLRRQQLNASTNIWPDFDSLHGTMLD